MVKRQTLEQRNELYKFVMSLPETQITVEEANGNELGVNIPGGVGAKRVRIAEEVFSTVVNGSFWPWQFQVIEHDIFSRNLTCLMFCLLPDGEAAVSYD